jgi:hypothetical protein
MNWLGLIGQVVNVNLIRYSFLNERIIAKPRFEPIDSRKVLWPEVSN